MNMNDFLWLAISVICLGLGYLALAYSYFRFSKRLDDLEKKVL